MSEFRQCFISSVQKEKRRARRPSQEEKRRAHRTDAATRQPLRWQLFSRALTVAVYTFGFECGKRLALPTWLRVVSTYSVAATVPVLLPSAHGENCRVGAVNAASTLAAARVSVASAVGVSIMRC